MARGPAVSGVGSGGMSEPARKAEMLFETSTIAEIREVESKAKAEIEDKKEALRHLVGDSYRDLISSADTILAMANTCSAVVQNVAGLQGDLHSLATQLSADHNGKPSTVIGGATKHDQLHAVGGRVKFLVDTPETLWGHLDAAALLPAARRFLRAQLVHGVLGTAAASTAVRQFPLVRTQWPLVAKFRPQILERLRLQLSSNTNLTAAEAADALAASAYLEHHSSEEVLALYLSCRLELLKTQLQHAGSAEQLPSLLSSIASLVQDTTAQVGHLFVQSSAGGLSAAQPQLAALATVPADAADTAELFFGALSGSSSSLENPEADQWQELAQAAAVRLAPIPESTAAQCASGWLQDAAAAVAAGAPQLLAAADAPSLLAATEAAVRGTLASWASETSQSAAEVSGMVRQGEEVWALVFEPAFLDHGKALIAAAFKAAVAALDAPLQAGLAAASSQMAASAGAFCSENWEPGLSCSHASVDDLYTESFHSTCQQGGWRPLVEMARSKFDTGLRVALEGALQLSQPGGPSESTAAARDRLYASAGPAHVGAKGRAAVLRPFVQDRCQTAGQEAAEKLQQSLATVGDVSTPSSAEGALLVARLAAALATQTPVLQVILGDPAGWQGTISMSHLASPGTSVLQRSTSRQHDGKIGEVQDALRGVASTALGSWAAWAGAHLAQDLAGGYSNDNALTAACALRGWQETTVAADDGGDGDIRFMLPGSPSPTLLVALVAASRELDRAGGHGAGMLTVDTLKWHLSEHLLAALHHILKPPSDSGGFSLAALTEKGVLQLLFDAALAHRTLAGPRPSAEAQLARRSPVSSRLLHLVLLARTSCSGP